MMIRYQGDDEAFPRLSNLVLVIAAWLDRPLETLASSVVIPRASQFPFPKWALNDERGSGED